MLSLPMILHVVAVWYVWVPLEKVAGFGTLQGNGTCNPIFSHNETCANSHSFSVNINGGCQPSDVKSGCWLIYNCICNGTLNGYQFTGYEDDQCSGNQVAVHTLPIETCHPDHSACDGPDDPIDGYVYLSTAQFELCCPQCASQDTEASFVQ